MKQILLTQGFVALVDDEDYEVLAALSWTPAHRGSGVYAVHYKRRKGEPRTCTLMHRLILDAPPGLQVDHANGNTLDNRRSNIRLATRSQNQANSRRTRGASRFKGVNWFSPKGCWVAKIGLNQCSRHLGYFADEEAAARAYDDAAREVFGPFAALNFPRPGEQSAHRISEIGAPAA